MMRSSQGPVWAVLALTVFGFAADAAAAGTTHTVVRRDTLSRIALRYCGVVEAYRVIAVENGIKNPNLIHPGRVLNVSCATAKPPQPAAQATAHVEQAPKAFRADVRVDANRTVTMELPNDPHMRLWAQTIPYWMAERNPRTEELERFACNLFGEACAVYLAVTKAENGKRTCNVRGSLNPNGTYDYGWAQMNSVHIRDYPQFDFSSCEENILASYLHYRKYGFGRWVAYLNGAYRQYLPQYERFMENFQRMQAAVSAGENEN